MEVELVSDDKIMEYYALAKALGFQGNYRAFREKFIAAWLEAKNG